MAKTKIGIGILAVVVVLVVALAGTALAQEGTPPATPSPDSQPGKMRGLGPGGQRAPMMMGKYQMEAAASALGMTVEELSTQLWGGKTLADLAEEAGVDLQAIRDAAEAAQKAAQKDAIEQAVTNGKLSREKADWLLEGLDKGYWGDSGNAGFGFGVPSGFGGMRGFGGKPGRGGFGTPPDKTAPDSGESGSSFRSAPSSSDSDL